MHGAEAACGFSGPRSQWRERPLHLYGVLGAAQRRQNFLNSVLVEVFLPMPVWPRYDVSSAWYTPGGTFLPSQSLREVAALSGDAMHPSVRALNGCPSEEKVCVWAGWGPVSLGNVLFVTML